MKAARSRRGSHLHPYAKLLAGVALAALAGVLVAVLVDASERGQLEARFSNSASSAADDFRDRTRVLLDNVRAMAQVMSGVRGNLSLPEAYSMANMALSAQIFRDAGTSLFGTNAAASTFAYVMLVRREHRDNVTQVISELFGRPFFFSSYMTEQRHAHPPLSYDAELYAPLVFGFRPRRIADKNASLTDYLTFEPRRDIMNSSLAPDAPLFTTRVLWEVNVDTHTMKIVYPVVRCPTAATVFETCPTLADLSAAQRLDPAFVDGWIIASVMPSVTALALEASAASSNRIFMSIYFEGYPSWRSPEYAAADEWPQERRQVQLSPTVAAQLSFRASATYKELSLSGQHRVVGLFVFTLGVIITVGVVAWMELTRKMAQTQVAVSAELARRASAFALLNGLCA